MSAFVAINPDFNPLIDITKSDSSGPLDVQQPQWLSNRPTSLMKTQRREPRA